MIGRNVIMAAKVKVTIPVEYEFDLESIIFWEKYLICETVEQFQKKLGAKLTIDIIDDITGSLRDIVSKQVVMCISDNKEDISTMADRLSESLQSKISKLSQKYLDNYTDIHLPVVLSNILQQIENAEDDEDFEEYDESKNY